jgi:hypothetical protein
MAENEGGYRGTSHERLHERARELINTGALPRQDTGPLYAGYGGAGHHCELCRSPITSKEVEYELEFGTSTVKSLRKIIRFHLACHAIWDYERKHLP